MASSNNIPTSSRSFFGAASHGRNGSDQGCNSCNKSLKTTLYVCSCDCVFCEECTYEHFATCSSCPSCGKTLGTNDFLELVIADPTAATQGGIKTAFQTLFTKYSLSATTISQREMCARILGGMDENRKTVKFLLKQLVHENNADGKRLQSLERELHELKKENTQLKQTMNTERIGAEKTIADLQARIQALTTKDKEQQAKIQERDTQVARFRGIFAAEGQARIPSSSHSIGSSSGGGKRGRQNPRTYQAAATPPSVPALQQRQSRAPFSRDNVNSTRYDQPALTPIQRSPGHHLSSGGPDTSAGLPPNMRIRDFTSASGYRFTSLSSRSGEHPSQRSRNNAMSPTVAFAYNQHVVPSSRQSSALGGYRRR